MNPQSAVTISGPVLTSEAIAGRPHAIASSRANPKPSEYMVTDLKQLHHRRHGIVLFEPLCHRLPKY
jgi:hypothetical protein